MEFCEGKRVRKRIGIDRVDVRLEEQIASLLVGVGIHRQCAVCSLRLISIAAQDPTRPSLRYPTPKRGPPKNLAVSEIRTNGRFKSCKPDKSDYRSIGGIDPKDMRNSYSKIACTRTVAISQRSQPNCVEANRIQQTGSGRDPLSGLRLPDVRHGKMGFLSLSITPR
ncbi:hypothetical protein PoMZ_02256 [Pyricularia oryzae]|uniref:Uncharacterized protein n=1 Tax=Pyricularia oryzae TaxID=318829 RepID=A0A4P7N6V7_PYROR|nr:hypothetical protein PoMZ_02256 [Pyricularia oryzae]